MPQDPFPFPPGDAEEPGSSPLNDCWDGPEGVGQGLFVCLPAEQLTLAGFAQNGEADTMAPGPLLATIMDTVTGEDGSGLAGCSDDQLVGIISAAQRMESRVAWTRMAAMREFAARRKARRGVGGGPGPAHRRDARQPARAAPMSTMSAPSAATACTRSIAAASSQVAPRS